MYVDVDKVWFIVTLFIAHIETVCVQQSYTYYHTVSGRRVVCYFYYFCFLQTKNFRSDGYEWKTRKTTKAVREDRMKLKVGGYQVCTLLTIE